MLYGGDAERAEIAALLERARAGRSGALVLRGEPGIGKTALLDDAREQAVDMHVLSARGVESESDLPFAALHRLVRPALGLLARLPPPQAAALGGALGLDDGAADERFLVCAACPTLLAEHAARRPVLCLVDDAQSCRPMARPVVAASSVRRGRPVSRGPTSSPSLSRNGLGRRGRPGAPR